jgi:hypothetical protein
MTNCQNINAAELMYTSVKQMLEDEFWHVCIQLQNFILNKLIILQEL